MDRYGGYTLLSKRKASSLEELVSAVSISSWMEKDVVAGQIDALSRARRPAGTYDGKQWSYIRFKKRLHHSTFSY
jgi:hypothetical protein